MPPASSSKPTTIHNFGGNVAFCRIIIALARWLPDSFCPLAYRAVLPSLVPRGWRVVDRSDRQLTMQHQLYRHIETELFVKRSQLSPMLSLTRWLLQWCAGLAPSACAEWSEAIARCDAGNDIQRLQGQYRHHYPICIRKVQSDSGFLTMSGSDDDEAYYAVSFISYVDPSKRDGFLRFASVITRLSGYLFTARPHWGKYWQAPLADVERLYPNYDKFIQIRDRLDPTGAFRPPWMDSTERSSPGPTEL